VVPLRPLRLDPAEAAEARPLRADEAAEAVRCATYNPRIRMSFF